MTKNTEKLYWIDTYDNVKYICFSSENEDEAIDEFIKYHTDRIDKDTIISHCTRQFGILCLPIIINPVNCYAEIFEGFMRGILEFQEEDTTPEINKPWDRKQNWNKPWAKGKRKR